MSTVGDAPLGRVLHEVTLIAKSEHFARLDASGQKFLKPDNILVCTRDFGLWLIFD